jgi:tRNA pseudouridine38-40 synthase
VPTYIAKVFYLGTAYHGSQWQPNVRTIQGELINALVSWSKEEHTQESVTLSGRTDRGVSSLGQIVRFTTDKKPNLERINSHLPDDISLWSVSEVSSDYNPRYSVLARHYRYYLDTTSLVLDFSRIKQSERYLIGSNNYALLSKPDADRNTNATILNVTSKRVNNLLVFDFYGISFLWKLVRKSVTLLKWIGLNLYSPKVIRNLLNGEKVIPGGIEPAPPEGLVLVEAIIPFRMKPDIKAIKRIRKTIMNRMGLHRRTATMLHEINHDYFFGQTPFY